MEQNNYNLPLLDIYSEFAATQVRVYIKELLKKFRDYYLGLGYLEESPALITSGIDPTVRFVGSGISVLKHYISPFGKDLLPNPGVFVIQKSVRARNKPYLMDDTKIPNWGSLFNNIVWITNPDRLKEATEETFRFFFEVLHIPKNNLMIRVKSTDHDLWRYAEPYVDIIEIDTKPDSYYTHKLGTNALNARSYNVALRGAGLGTETFEDIGNIILHENTNGEKQLVEIGFGDSTILRSMRGGHVIDWHLVPGLLKIKSPARIKMADELATCVELSREGLQPSSKDNSSKLFKAYLHGLLRHAAVFGFSLSELESIIDEYEKIEFPNNTQDMGKVVTEHLAKLLKKIVIKRFEDLSPDELKLKLILRDFPIKGNYQYLEDPGTIALVPVINRFNDPVIVSKYRKAIDTVGIWNSEKKIIQRFLKKSDKILEIGCGTGRVTFGLVAKGYKDIIGVDLAEKLLAIAKDYAKIKSLDINFSVQDARSLKFSSKSFDGILFLFNGLMAVPLKSNRQRVLVEVSRLLKHGGLFIFTTHDRSIDKTYKDFWNSQKSVFKEGKQEPGQYEFGDLVLKGAEDDAFIHIPTTSEVRGQLVKNGFEVIYTKMRSKISPETKLTKEFSSDCRFWVARKN